MEPTVKLDLGISLGDDDLFTNPKEKKPYTYLNAKIYCLDYASKNEAIKAFIEVLQKELKN